MSRRDLAPGLSAYRDAVSRHFGVLYRTPRERLCFVTVIVAAHVVEAGEDWSDIVRDQVEEYHRARRVALMRSGRVSRAAGKPDHTRWAGCIELDLLHPHLVCSNLKIELLQGLGIDLDTVRADQRVMLIHEHAIIDTSGHETADVLTRDLRKTFPGPRRVHSTPLHQEGSVADQLDNLAKYCTKTRHSYSTAYLGRATRYHAPYEPEWTAFVRQTYADIGYDNLFNTNINVQKSSLKNGFQNVVSDFTTDCKHSTISDDRGLQWREPPTTHDHLSHERNDEPEHDRAHDQEPDTCRPVPRRKDKERSKLPRLVAIAALREEEMRGAEQTRKQQEQVQISDSR